MLNYITSYSQHEIGICRKEQPFEIRPIRLDSSMDFQPDSPPLAMEIEPPPTSQEPASEAAGKDAGTQEAESQGAGEGEEEPQPSTSSEPSPKPLPDYSAAKTGT